MRQWRNFWLPLFLCVLATQSCHAAVHDREHGIQEDPYYYCDACATTVEEFHAALQDDLDSRTRRSIGASGNSEMRLDMVEILQRLCKQRLNRYRPDIVDGCNQIVASNHRPLILEFAAEVTSASLAHERTQRFCVQKLQVCPSASASAEAYQALPAESRKTCGQCVLVMKDMLRTYSRWDQRLLRMSSDGQRQQDRARECRKAAWDTVERECDALPVRYGDSKFARSCVDTCVDLVDEHDAELVDVLLRYGQDQHHETAPAGTDTDSDTPLDAEGLRRAAVRNVCVEMETLCKTESQFEEAFESIPVSAWLRQRPREDMVYVSDAPPRVEL